VLSVPFNLRFVLASRAEAFTALTRIFLDETLGWYRQNARDLGVPRGRGGAVSVQHRFGGALNLNCHAHAVVIDDNGGCNSIDQSSVVAARFSPLRMRSASSRASSTPSPTYQAWYGVVSGTPEGRQKSAQKRRTRPSFSTRLSAGDRPSPGFASLSP
jgi:hypothetical protein